MEMRKAAVMLGLAAAFGAVEPRPLMHGGGWRKPPGRPGVKKLRAKRKVRNRMAKISRRRNRAG